MPCISEVCSRQGIKPAAAHHIMKEQVAGFLIFTIVYLMLFGNGCADTQVEAYSGNQVVISQGKVDYLHQQFLEVQDCMEDWSLPWEKLIIVLREPAWPCDYYETGCGGEFFTTYVIHVGYPQVAKHEYVHAIRYYATGNADGQHQSPAFTRCTGS